MTGTKPTRGHAILGTRIWADVAVYSVVLVCECCDWQGVAFGREQARTLCADHWERHPGVKGFTKHDVSTGAPCRAESNCTAKIHGRGLCRKHYNAWQYQARKEQGLA